MRKWFWDNLYAVLALFGLMAGLVLIYSAIIFPSGSKLYPVLGIFLLAVNGLLIIARMFELATPKK
jgi:hypothetical protein